MRFFTFDLLERIAPAVRVRSGRCQSFGATKGVSRRNAAGGCPPWSASPGTDTTCFMYGSLKCASSSAGVRQFSNTGHREVLASRRLLIPAFWAPLSTGFASARARSKRLRAAPLHENMCHELGSGEPSRQGSSSAEMGPKDSARSTALGTCIEASLAKSGDCHWFIRLTMRGMRTKIERGGLRINLLRSPLLRDNPGTLMPARKAP